MLKILLKKQFLEIKNSYFSNKRTKGALSKKGILLKVSLIIFILFTVALSFYEIALMLLETIEKNSAIWLYFTLFALMSLFMSVVINMFMTNSTLYSAKDNELLLSMPIKTKDIILSRMIVLYLNGMVYSGMVYIPIVARYLMTYGFKLNVLLANIVLFIVINIIGLVLSCLFGFIVAVISKRFKNNSFITTLIYIVFIVAYYFIYFNFEKYLNSILANISIINEQINKIYLLYVLGKAGTGDILSLTIVFSEAIVLLSLLLFIVNKTYIKTITYAGGVKKGTFKSNYAKQNSVNKTLLKKELKRFTSNTTYLMNNGLGVLILIAAPIILYFKKNELLTSFNTLKNEVPFIGNAMPLFVCILIVLILSADCIATPSVSLEGNTYWILRSLPIKTIDILQAKLKLEFYIHIIPLIVSSLVCAYMLEFDTVYLYLFIIFDIAYLYFSSNFHLYLGIIGANLDWTSEIVPIKQNFNVAIAIFVGMGICALLFGGYYLTYSMLTLNQYIAIIAVVFALIGKSINFWIVKKGTVRYEHL